MDARVRALGEKGDAEAPVWLVQLQFQVLADRAPRAGVPGSIRVAVHRRGERTAGIGPAEARGVGRGAARPDRTPGGAHLSQRVFVVVRWIRALRHAAERVIPHRVEHPGRVFGGADLGIRVGHVAVVVIAPGGRVGEGLWAAISEGIRARAGARELLVKRPHARSIGAAQGAVGSIQPGEGLGACIDDLHLLGVDLPQPTGRLRCVPASLLGINGEDAHLRGLLVPEGRDLAEATRAPQRAQHRMSPRGIRGHRQVRAHQHVAHALGAQGRGQGGQRLPGVHLALNAIQPADGIRLHERHGVAHHPRHIQQRLGGLVASVAPGLATETRLRQQHHATVFRLVAVLIQPVRGLPPVLRYFAEAIGRGDPAGPAGGGGQHGQKHGGEHLHHVRVLLRVAPLLHARPIPARDLHMSQRVGHAHHQRQPHQDVEFVQVAQRGARAVEEGPRPAGEQGEGIHRDPERDQPYAQHAQPHPGGWESAPGKPPQAEQRHREGGQDEHRLADQGGTGHALGGKEGDPAGRAPQVLQQVQPAGGQRTGLDVVRERRGVAAQDQQRADPPEADRQPSGHPPAAEVGHLPPGVAA